MRVVKQQIVRYEPEFPIDFITIYTEVPYPRGKFYQSYSFSISDYWIKKNCKLGEYGYIFTLEKQKELMSLIHG